jgi:hypothetical protein
MGSVLTFDTKLALLAIISDGLTCALSSVALAADVMIEARLFGYLLHRHRSYKAARTGRKRALGVLSWFDALYWLTS